MKKLKIFLGIFVAVAVIIGGSLFAMNYQKEIEKYDENLDAFLKEKPGIYYLYYDGCPWCKDLKPVFKEVMNEKDERYQALDIHHKHLSAEKKDQLTKEVKKYTKKDKIIVPLIVFISEDGKSQYHIGTVPTHDATEYSLNGKQRDALKKDLNKLYNTYEKHNQKPVTSSQKEVAFSLSKRLLFSAIISIDSLTGGQR